MKPFFYLSLLLAATTAQAQTIESALKACTQQENSLKRLVCYDNLVKNLNQYHGLNKAVSQTSPHFPSRPMRHKADIAAVTKPDTGSSSTDGFGMRKQQAASEELDKITSQATKVTESLRGYLIVTLENGQVWRQIDNESMKIKQGNTVFVERAALGSFRMGKPNANKRIRVKRVK